MVYFANLAKNESTWRQILEYFEPAYQLGMNATPKRDVNADTYRYFGRPVYEYSLLQGIEDGFLTPFRVQKATCTIDDYERRLRHPPARGLGWALN